MGGIWEGGFCQRWARGRRAGPWEGWSGRSEAPGKRRRRCCATWWRLRRNLGCWHRPPWPEPTGAIQSWPGQPESANHPKTHPDEAAESNQRQLEQTGVIQSLQLEGTGVKQSNGNCWQHWKIHGKGALKPSRAAEAGIGNPMGWLSRIHSHLDSSLAEWEALVNPLPKPSLPHSCSPTLLDTESHP